MVPSERAIKIDDSGAAAPESEAIPINEKCKVRRKPPRDWLHEREVEAMITAAGRNRHAERDKTLILVCYRHGLRVGELVALEWAHIDFQTGLRSCAARRTDWTARNR